MTTNQIAKTIRSLGVTPAYYDNRTVCMFSQSDAESFAAAMGWGAFRSQIEAANTNDGTATMPVWAVSASAYDPMCAARNNCD